MRSFVSVAVLSATLLSSTSALAAPHIGMKLACKRYGEAMNSGSRAAVMSASTSSFAYQWGRMPQEVFAQIPRANGGKVLGSSKGNGSGTVTVATSQGVVTFLVVGRGFNWTVADIYKAGDDGRTVSLSSYLDLTLTANEFMRDLKYVGGSSFHDSASSHFKTAFKDLSPDQLNRIRDFLPEVRRNKPYVVMNGGTGTMRMQVPNGKPHETVTFKMVHDGSWKVDDSVVSSDTTKIPSFKRSLPLLACVTAFRSFAGDPHSVNPQTFVCKGDLCETLMSARTENPFPLKAAGKALHMSISEDGQIAQIRYPDRDVRIEMGDVDGQPAIAKITVKTGDRWAHLEHMLALKKQMRPFAGLLASAKPASSPAPIAKPESQPSVLANVSAVETIVGKPVAMKTEVKTEAPKPVLKPAPKVVAQAVPAVASQPAVQSTSHAVREIQPVSYQYQSKREYKRAMRRSRRGW
ncbi:MAG: hypothetical protein U1D30_24170 [Planctomycetota bacterium]